MDTRIASIYENGVLRPLTPLFLPEYTRVQVSVEKVEETPADISKHHPRVQEALAAAGLSSSEANPSCNQPNFSRTARGTGPAVCRRPAAL